MRYSAAREDAPMRRAPSVSASLRWHLDMAIDWCRVRSRAWVPLAEGAAFVAENAVARKVDPGRLPVRDGVDVPLEALRRVAATCREAASTDVERAWHLMREARRVAGGGAAVASPMT